MPAAITPYEIILLPFFLSLLPLLFLPFLFLPLLLFLLLRRRRLLLRPLDESVTM
jgi:hypothetical protein